MNQYSKVALGPDVTFGMSAFGNYQTTQEALSALFSSVEGDFELILVDDCSPDDTRSLFIGAQSMHSNTRVLGFDANKEYSGTLNAILSHATGDFVIFLSNDIFVTPAYVRELLSVARKDKRHGIVRGCSNFVDNNFDTHTIPLPQNVNNWSQLAAFAENFESANRGKYIYDPFLTGDAFLVTREVIDRIGTFDPFFFGYFADHDYGIRARIAGFELVLAQGAYALHKRAANFEYLPPDIRQKKRSNRWAKVHENWARFKIKYGFPVELPYQYIHDIEWDRLCSVPFDAAKHHAPPKDYSEYFL